jgi:DNA-directed RNA polymerase specialized sigma24 family protein
VLAPFYSEHLTQDQIAQKMDLPLNTSKHHLSKGRYLIKKQVGCTEYENAFKVLYNEIFKK